MTYTNASDSNLTAATPQTGSLATRTWDYDGVDNWDTSVQQIVGSAASTETRTDTNFNEIAVRTVDAVPTSLAHDAEGNQTDSGTYEYVWDAYNRLRTVTRKSDGLLVATYSYDSGNRRVQKAVTNSGALDGTTTFYYMGWRVMEEYDRVGLAETLTYQYVWGGTYLDAQVSRDDRSSTVAQLNDGVGSDRQYLHANAQYNTYAVTDSAGTILERYEYSPYGSIQYQDAAGVPPVAQSSSIGQEFLYTGQRLDEETGKYYFKNRYYDNEQGKFISRDPIGYQDGMNLYAGYFADSGSLDPHGLERTRSPKEGKCHKPANEKHNSYNRQVTSINWRTWGKKDWKKKVSTEDASLAAMNAVLTWGNLPKEIFAIKENLAVWVANRFADEATSKKSELVDQDDIFDFLYSIEGFMQANYGRELILEVKFDYCNCPDGASEGKWELRTRYIKCTEGTEKESGVYGGQVGELAFNMSHLKQCWLRAESEGGVRYDLTEEEVLREDWRGVSQGIKFFFIIQLSTRNLSLKVERWIATERV